MVNRLRHIHIYIRDGLLDLMAALPDVAVNSTNPYKKGLNELRFFLGASSFDFGFSCFGSCLGSSGLGTSVESTLTPSVAVTAFGTPSPTIFTTGASEKKRLATA